jgi:hypothetical protein
MFRWGKIWKGVCWESSLKENSFEGVLSLEKLVEECFFGSLPISIDGN